MRAVVQDRYGGPDVLTVKEVPTPKPASGEVLLRVDAAGIDRGTWHLLYGLPLLARLESGLRHPKRTVPGFDVSGVVVGVGGGVSAFALGDRVCGIARGSFAAYAPALARKLAPCPITVDSTHAGVLAISGLTALQAIRDHARAEAGHRVLVLGASGGVGTYAVQIAHAFGADVTAVCSAAKADIVRKLGADRVLDYESNDPLDRSVLYNAIIDIGGRRTLRDLRGALAPQGRAVLVGGEGGGRITGGYPSRMLGALVASLLRGRGGRRLIGFVSKEDGTDIAELVRLVESGAIRPQVDRVVGLDDVADAIRDLDAGLIHGKIAVRP